MLYRLYTAVAAAILLLIASTTFALQATLIWTPSDRATGYRIYSYTPGFETDMTVVDVENILTVTLEISPDTRYFFVKAYNEYGESDPSNTVSIQCPTADFNHDGVVNSLDYNIFAECWLRTGPFAADLNSDGIVDNTDYNLFSDQWLNTCKGVK